MGLGADGEGGDERRGSEKLMHDVFLHWRGWSHPSLPIR
jgi:hypothetical protein